MLEKAVEDHPGHVLISLGCHGWQQVVKLESEWGGDSAKMKSVVSSKPVLRGILQIYKHILTN